MKQTLVLLILLLLPNPVLGAESDCVREISVQEVFYRSNPNPFIKVTEPYRKGDKKQIMIDCQLYSQISVGDELSEPGDNVDRIRLFSGDKGVLERKHYLVLKK